MAITKQFYYTSNIFKKFVLWPLDVQLIMGLYKLCAPKII